MAILESLPGIEVNIESQGRVLPEYEDEEEWNHDRLHVMRDDRKKSVYVECVSDAEFSIQCCLTEDFRIEASAVTLGLEVDGKPIADKVLKIGPRSFSSLTSSCELVGPNEVIRRRLKFASIRKVDDDDSTRVKNDSDAIPGVGEIVLTLHRTIQGQYEWVASGPLTPLKGAPSEVAEKALKGKALSHGVAFGEERREHRGRIMRDHYPDGRDNPTAIFCFKYRSREALQQEMIIPRSPSPKIATGQLSSCRSYNDEIPIYSEEKLAKIKREMGRIKSEVKKEDGDNPLSQRGHKRDRDARGEASSGPAYKTSRKRDGTVVVDLTDD